MWWCKHLINIIHVSINSIATRKITCFIYFQEFYFDLIDSLRWYWFFMWWATIHGREYIHEHLSLCAELTQVTISHNQSMLWRRLQEVRFFVCILRYELSVVGDTIIKFFELNWKSPCCLRLWIFTFFPSYFSKTSIIWTFDLWQNAWKTWMKLSSSVF